MWLLILLMPRRFILHMRSIKSIWIKILMVTAIMVTGMNYLYEYPYQNYDLLFHDLIRSYHIDLRNGLLFKHLNGSFISQQAS